MKTFAFSVVVLSALCGQVFAQGQGGTTRPATQPVQSGQQAGQQQAGQASNHSQQLQQHSAACLLIGNQEEIALSELGIERAESDQVKEFAREMVKEHTKMISQLRKFTPQTASFELNVKADDQAAGSSNVRQNEGNQKKSNQSQGAGQAAGQGQATQSTRSGEATAAAAGGAASSAGSITDQLLMMKRDKAHECLKINKQTLMEHKGAEFDQAFLGVQVAAHISMLAELRALEGKVGGDFGQLISEAEKSTKEHLDHAKDLMEKVAKSDSSNSGSNRSERSATKGSDRPRNERPSGREG